MVAMRKSVETKKGEMSREEQLVMNYRILEAAVKTFEALRDTVRLRDEVASISQIQCDLLDANGNGVVVELKYETNGDLTQSVSTPQEFFDGVSADRKLDVEDYTESDENKPVLN